MPILRTTKTAEMISSIRNHTWLPIESSFRRTVKMIDDGPFGGRRWAAAPDAGPDRARAVRAGAAV